MITGVVLGGTSLFGGYGWMVGTVIGILIPATLNNGFIIAQRPAVLAAGRDGIDPDRRRVPRPTQAPFARAGLINEGGEAECLTYVAQALGAVALGGHRARGGTRRRVGAPAASPTLGQQSKYSVVYIPGLTGNPFYSTVACGASVAAKKLGVSFSVQGAPTFAVNAQTPVVNAVSPRHPDGDHDLQ